jgi:hypothetical protein
MQGDDLLGGFGSECGGIAAVRRFVQGAKAGFHSFLTIFSRFHGITLRPASLAITADNQVRKFTGVK